MIIFLICAEGSSKRSLYATLIPCNDAYSSINVASIGQNSRAQEQNNYSRGGLIAGGNNNMFPSANNVGPSNVAPSCEGSYSQQSINEGG